MTGEATIDCTSSAFVWAFADKEDVSQMKSLSEASEKNKKIRSFQETTKY